MVGAFCWKTLALFCYFFVLVYLWCFKHRSTWQAWNTFSSANAESRIAALCSLSAVSTFLSFRPSLCSTLLSYCSCIIFKWFSIWTEKTPLYRCKTFKKRYQSTCGQANWSAKSVSFSLPFPDEPVCAASFLVLVPVPPLPWLLSFALVLPFCARRGNVPQQVPIDTWIYKQLKPFQLFPVWNLGVWKISASRWIPVVQMERGMSKKWQLGKIEGTAKNSLQNSETCTCLFRGWVYVKVDKMLQEVRIRQDESCCFPVSVFAQKTTHSSHDVHN